MSQFFRKHVLQAKTYYTPQGQLVVTPDRLKHWEKSFRQIKQLGYHPPTRFNHQSEIDKLCPIRIGSEVDAADTVGHLEDFKVSPDGKSAILTMSIKNPSAIESAKSNSVFVSPVIWEDSWTDGAGNKHSDIIGTVDLVDYPVDYSQGPFEPITMSAKPSDKSKPKIIRFSTLAEEPMDDETMNIEPTTETMEVAAEVPQTNSVLSAVLGGLSALRIVLPADTDTENFLDRLNVALMTVAAQEEKPEEESNTVADSGEQQSEPVSPQIATMSARVKALESRIINQERAAVETRLKSLLDSGRCTPAEFRSREASLKIQKLSLVGEKLQTGDLGTWIESREAIPEGSCWDKSEKISKMSASKTAQKTSWEPTKTAPDNEANRRAKQVMLRS